MDASPQSPSHSVVINVAKSRKGALPERVSFGEGKPECVTEDAWNNVTPALQVLSASSASKKQHMDCLFINLETRTDRRESIEGELAKAGIKGSRLSAMTGHDASDACVTRTWDTSLNATYDPTTLKKGRTALTPGERGCSMSHVVMWARCAAQGDSGPPLLVVEDDVVFVKNTGEKLKALIKHLEATNPDPSQRLMLLYLTGDVAEWRHSRSQSVADCPGVKLREAAYIWQTACYVIWPAAARKLLSSLPVDGPVDNFISKHSLSQRVCALVTQPNLARQAAPYEEGDIAHSGHTYKKNAFGKAPDPHTSPTRKVAAAGAAREADSPGTHLMHHLAEIPGVGPKLGQTLRDHVRALDGGLTRAEQLDNVPGLGKKRQADIVRYLQLLPSASAAPAAAAAAATKVAAAPCAAMPPPPVPAAKKRAGDLLTLENVSPHTGKGAKQQKAA